MSLVDEQVNAMEEMAMGEAAMEEAGSGWWRERGHCVPPGKMFSALPVRLTLNFPLWMSMWFNDRENMFIRLPSLKGADSDNVWPGC